MNLRRLPSQHGDFSVMKRKSTDAIHQLTPELSIETYKNWQYFKKNQRDMTDH